MKKPRIFLTGSRGYIGRNILKQLEGKYDFFYPDHQKLDLLETLNVEKFFKKSKFFDVVVHCAFVGGPRSFTDTAQTLNDNLKIFFNIVRNRKYFGKLINLGSGAEYGKQRALKKVSEKQFDEIVPLDYYGFAKYLIAKYIELSNNFINLRLFGVYGRYEDTSLRFISNALCKSILGMPITINRNVYFDYLYIYDFVRILDYFLTRKVRHKSYNVGTGKRMDLVTVANKIIKLTHHKLPIKIKLAGFANEYTCDNKRLLKEMGDFKFTEFDKSVEELYEWYLEKKSSLKRKNFLDDHFK